MAGHRVQYFAIAPMRGLNFRKGMTEAAKADILSLTAFLMRIGMIIGFFTAYPANVWLIRRGIKEAM